MLSKMQYKQKFIKNWDLSKKKKVSCGLDLDENTHTQLLIMLPRNIIWEETVEDKFRAIKIKRLELNKCKEELKYFRKQKKFLDDLTYKYYDHIHELREYYNINDLNTSFKISELQQEINNLGLNIEVFEHKIKKLTEQETKMYKDFSDLKRDLGQFIEQNIEEE